MKKFLFDWFIPSSYERVLGNMVLLLVGLLIVTGGRIGIQVTPESDTKWIEAFAGMDAWLGWMLVSMAFDGLLFNGKALTFLLSKTVVPVMRAVLSNVLGEEKMDAFMKRFEKKEKVMNRPLTLVEVKDLARKSKFRVLLTKEAYERTADGVLDYAEQCEVEVIRREEE